ncbi:MAG: hypothetical protein C3F11_21890 [Methylocystaceae bacterium]|nr:MAG: hypothetical protein C3F11_21890 [Methylocystaceae bacterium]
MTPFGLGRRRSAIARIVGPAVLRDRAFSSNHTSERILLRRPRRSRAVSFMLASSAPLAEDFLKNPPAGTRAPAGPN